MMTTDKRFEALDLSINTRTTGIGSLPHHNVDAALDYAFKFGIPYLPQIPIRNPWEYMIPQALEGLPGLQVEKDGATTLNYDIWKSDSHRLESRLNTAFSSDQFEIFEPSAAVSSCWPPFLWELQERNYKVAKVQICGPMTAQWALRMKDGSPSDKDPAISTQVFQLVLARAMAMVKRLMSCGIQPIIYLDEPGLYAFSPLNPKHVLCIQELRLVVQSLRKQGALVGLHCCSNTAWESVFKLGMDFLSIDSSLSLKAAFVHPEGIRDFLESGGRLSLGIIPTGRPSALHGIAVREMVDQAITVLKGFKNTLQTALFTPACGLALQSTSDAELILEKLVEAYDYFRN